MVYPLSRGTGPLLSTATAIVAFGERPGPVALAGAALIVAAVFSMIRRSEDRGAAAPVHRARNRTPAGPAGVSRAVGSAKAAGLSGLAAVRGKLEGMGSRRVEGPPDETISFPTRTFRSGSRQRIVMAAVLGALLLLLLTGAGVWALLASGDGTNAASNPGNNEREQAAANPPEERADGQADQPSGQQPSNEAGSNTSGGGSDAAPAEGDAPPLAEAEQAVFDMYVEQSYQTPETSFAYLSERLKNEVGFFFYVSES